VAGLALVACGDGRDGDGALRPQATPTTVTSTTAPAGAATTTTTTVAAAPATTTTARRVVGGGGATASPAGGQPVPGAEAPAATGPPAVGTYRYDTVGASTFGLAAVPFPAVTTLMVDSPTGTRQRSVRDLRDPSGTGARAESVLDYRPDGVHLLSLRVTTRVGGATDVRELRPAAPVLFLPTSAGPGARAELDLPVNGGAPAHVVVEVVAEEPVTVGDSTVDALVIRAVTTLPPGPVSGRQDVTVWFDRGSRLIVRERQVTDVVAGLLTFHSEYTATLQQLGPT
jgi:hypothetical protein